MTDIADAFLSYTRKDDEHFGGDITRFRETLELGVQAVTGNRSFTIFQDVDGIALGEKWQKKLNEAISAATLLIPVITPLFFSSPPCRDELSRFLEHETARGRDDTILPLYFLTAPVLDKPEELGQDPLASEVASRQIYDWRERVDVAPDDRSIRGEVRKLAIAIAAAFVRVTGGDRQVVTSFDRDRTGALAAGAAEKTLSDVVSNLSLERVSTKAHKSVLWVDDRPDNNILERRAMAAYNIDFVLALSTGEALAELRKRQFDAIISDMGRGSDPQAGYNLLEALRGSGDHTPYLIYAG